MARPPLGLLAAGAALTGAAAAWVAAAPDAGKTARKVDPDAAFKRIFRRLDADGNGVVTEKEYVGRSRWPEGKARKIWRASDADGDGKVTEAEYCRNRRVTDKAKELFVWIDADKDGNLSEQEVVATARRIFREMDTDKSGQVNIPEFLSTRWRWDVRVDWAKKVRPAPGGGPGADGAGSK